MKPRVLRCAKAILACPFETLRVRVMAPTEKRSFREIVGEAVLGRTVGIFRFFTRSDLSDK